MYWLSYTYVHLQILEDYEESRPNLSYTNEETVSLSDCLIHAQNSLKSIIGLYKKLGSKVWRESTREDRSKQ